VLIIATCAAVPAAAQLSAVAPKETPPCASVVVVRCDRVNPALSPRRASAQRVEERRRAAFEPLELDRIVIEADPLPGGVEDAMSGAFASRPAYGTHTFVTGEGSQCTCMNRCPPVPFPCCQCSAHMSHYSLSPGSAPLR
jgi:hypothetical protein